MTQTMRAMRLDFITVKQYLSPRYLAMYIGIAAFVSLANGANVGANGAFGIGMIMMYAMIFASYPFAIGEKTQMDLLYASLPLRRRDLVRGRYLYALCMQSLGAGTALVLAFVLSVVTRSPFALQESLVAVVCCFFVFSTISMMQLPIFFQLGYTKAKILGMLPFLILPLAAIPFFNMSQNPSEQFDVLRRTMAQNSLLLVLVGLVIYVVLYKISFALSLRFYERREL